MLRKLYGLVAGSCCADNPDSPQHQEVLLPGFLYGMIIKERLDEILNQIRSNIVLDVRNDESVDFNDSKCEPKYASFPEAPPQNVILRKSFRK
jgi:DNA-directed RNA polymerase I subunit RPA2